MHTAQAKALRHLTQARTALIKAQVQLHHPSHDAAYKALQKISEELLLIGYSITGETAEGS